MSLRPIIVTLPPHIIKVFLRHLIAHPKYTYFNLIVFIVFINRFILKNMVLSRDEKNAY